MWDWEHDIYLWETESITYWVHCIYPKEIEYKIFSHEWWSPQYLLLNDEVHSIYPMTDGVQGIDLWQMVSIGFTVGSDRVHSIYSLEIWIEQRLLVKNVAHIIY